MKTLTSECLGSLNANLDRSPTASSFLSTFLARVTAATTAKILNCTYYCHYCLYLPRYSCLCRSSRMLHINRSLCLKTLSFWAVTSVSLVERT